MDRAVTVLESGDEEVIDDMMSGRVGVKTAAEQVRPSSRIVHNSGNEEWYTPENILEAVRDVLGTIELDPASSAKANEVVKALKFFTAEDDGLEQVWEGKVYLNPPYTGGVVDKFVDKLVDSPSVIASVVLTNNCTETRWAQLLMSSASAVCFPCRRLRFTDLEGNVSKGSPLQGQMICGIGVDRDKFIAAFSEIGVVL